jgi:hypothetical protein
VLSFGFAAAQLSRDGSAAFEAGLRELGWEPGSTITVEYRWADNDRERLARHVAELIRSAPDVVVVRTGPAQQAVTKATRAIPIVLGGATDPVSQGFVQSLARPGGNVTGLSLQLAELLPKRIRLTADTLRLAEGYVRVRSLGRVPVKGVAEPVEVYEVTGAGAARSRLQAAAARGLSRFVGREGEIEQLRQALERAGAGHGQVVALVGEAGMGKSRLYWEFTHSHRTEGWLILESASVSYGKATVRAVLAARIDRLFTRGEAAPATGLGDRQGCPARPAASGGQSPRGCPPQPAGSPSGRRVRV